MEIPVERLRGLERKIDSIYRGVDLLAFFAELTKDMLDDLRKKIKKIEEGKDGDSE